MPTKKKPRASTKTTKKVVKKSVASAQSTRKPATASLLKNKSKKKSVVSGLNIGMHLVIAGSAIAILLLLGVVQSGTFSTGKSKAQDKVPVAIGLEHTEPLSISTLFAKKGNQGYLSFTNHSNETIHASFPSDWHQTEVNGASIDKFTADIPVFGFTRRAIPPYAGIKMLLPEVPAAVLFDNNSTSTAGVELSMVDLDTLSQTSRVVLVQKQSLATLWDNQE